MKHTSPNLSRRLAIVGLGAGVLAPAAARAVDAASLLGSDAVYGWAAMDMGNGKVVFANADVRFPMCSSVKWLLAAQVLASVDSGSTRLDREVRFGTADLVPSSTGSLAERLGRNSDASVSIRELCASAVSLSDSTATNILLRRFGGPSGLTRWLRGIGDPITRLDRPELELNKVPRGDLRDTTTPHAMMQNLHRVLYGRVLSATSRAILFQWMLECATGPTRLKAGLPAGWRIAHKTGTWMPFPNDGVRHRSASADLGVLLPPSGQPILVAAYTAGSKQPQPQIDQWFADLARSLSTTG
jgi:beta-lactamase class A